jgi:hypothetical protein
VTDPCVWCLIYLVCDPLALVLGLVWVSRKRRGK